MEALQFLCHAVIVCDPKQSSKPSLQPSIRGRFRTGPGSPPITELELSPEDRKHVATPKTGFTADRDKKGSNHHHSSAIPRPQGNYNTRPRTTQTDESDLEYRYEAERRDRRKLIVANAEVVPSSSESEVESKASVRDNNIQAKEPLNASKRSRPDIKMTGLGINFELDAKENGMDVRNRKDATSGYQNGSARTGPRPWHSSVTAGHPVAHVIESSQELNVTTGMKRDPDTEYQRRQAALLGIVSGLELGIGLTYAAGESEGSEYCGEDGFAISGSRDSVSSLAKGANRMASHAAEDRAEYEVGEKSISARSRTEMRPRSSNRMPMFLLSANDDEIYEEAPALSTPHMHRYPKLRTPSPNTGKGRKSPSRSPIIPQSSLPPIPAALRRHSVYHQPLLSSGSANDGENGEISSVSQHMPPSKHRESLRRRRDVDEDLLGVTCRPYTTAARERQAYGIPPSESIQSYSEVHQAISHADSDLSVASSVYWDDECESELSAGAETLFRKLSGKGTDWRTHQVCIIS